MVGAKGFEPSTLWSQTRCATRLRYTPTAGILTRALVHTDRALRLFTPRVPMSLPLPQALVWLHSKDPFPPVASAWPADSEAPGLLAAGADLSVARLHSAYQQGIFPWYSDAQPILWWSTDPRMVLPVDQFCLHRSLKRSLQHFIADPACEIRFDSAFARTIRACAQAPRRGQSGTWIVDAMVRAYENLHAAGHAHSVETWVQGELVGGLYCVCIGQAVFGESMFSLRSDASKIALAALVAWCRQAGVALVDCQQNTRHLASLGAHEMARADFVQHLKTATTRASGAWRFEPLYWKTLFNR